jgi:hypothetical protein
MEPFWRHFANIRFSRSSGPVTRLKYMKLQTAIS